MHHLSVYEGSRDTASFFTLTLLFARWIQASVSFRCCCQVSPWPNVYRLAGTTNHIRSAKAVGRLLCIKRSAMTRSEALSSVFRLVIVRLWEYIFELKMSMLILIYITAVTKRLRFSHFKFFFHLLNDLIINNNYPPVIPMLWWPFAPHIFDRPYHKTTSILVRVACFGSQIRNHQESIIKHLYEFYVSNQFMFYVSMIQFSFETTWYCTSGESLTMIMIVLQFVKAKVDLVVVYTHAITP